MEKGYSTAFALIPLALSGLGLALESTRRQALFFLLVAALYTALALETPLFTLYRFLPLGSQFRMPMRFLWLTSFCLCMAGAVGVEVLTRDSRRLRPAAKRLVCLFLVGVGLSYLLAFRRGIEGYVVVAAFSAILLAALWSSTSNRLARWVLPVMALAALVVGRVYPPFGYSARPSLFYEDEDVFDFVRGRMSLQDRMYQVTQHTDYSMQRKSASIFRIPSITDYETQTSERYAALFVRLLRDRPMRGVGDFYYQGSPIPQNRSLLDLLAVRFVIVDARRFDWRPAGFEVVREKAGVRILENPQAYPRAFYVPRAEVVSDPDRLLAMLASPWHEPKRVVLVEKTPEGGLGSEGGSGEVRIRTDRGEKVVMRVEATRKGFLFVSDQLYPGWRARVNGLPAEILRANYAFRAVAVPEGVSTVEFSYRPLSRRAGAWVSACQALRWASSLCWHGGGVEKQGARAAARVGPETTEPASGDPV